MLGGEIRSPLREAAPWCVKLGAEPRAGRELFCRYFGLGAGIFVTAPLDAALTFVRRQLKRLLRVELPSGKKALFRFYDPRVLRVFLPTCDLEQLALVAGSQHGLWIESEGGAQLLQVPADTSDGVPVAHDLHDEVGIPLRLQILRSPSHAPVPNVGVEIRQLVGGAHTAVARTDPAGMAELDTNALPVGTYDLQCSSSASLGSPRSLRSLRFCPTFSGLILVSNPCRCPLLHVTIPGATRLELA